MIRLMIKYGVLAMILLSMSAFRQPQKQELSFMTSDSRLQQTFDWAKKMALGYVGASTDPVGPWYEASLPQREAFCMRDVSHQCGGAEVLGLTKENFNMLFELADVLKAEVGASRAAVDAGFCEHERQIGQTGTTVRPKLYIACGISGQIQHTAGMEESSMVIAINTDTDAPINKFADYVITGDLNVVIPKMIQYYKKNSK